jgi:hypothetical protein
MSESTKRQVDYLLVGTGVAPLLAAQRLSNRGESVAILNPDADFFLENSELPLDLFSFESTNADLSKRFSNNLPEQVYRDLIPEFPGAIEMWKEEDDLREGKDFQVESAPWMRFRHRLWVAPQRSDGVEKLENLYLRALDLGWKPKWLEGVSLAKRFPGFSSKNLEARGLENCVGFLGPRFADIDVARYRTGLLEFVRERLGRENILTSAHVLDINQKGVRFQLASGPPVSMEVGRAILYFWTPKLERLIRHNLEKYQPRALAQFAEGVKRQLWEEWDILSRDPVNPSVVAHMESMRVWSHGEGAPPPGGWSRIKVMRREQSPSLLGEAGFQDLSKVIFQLLGWERFTVRGMAPRTLYRWNKTQPIEYDSDGVRTLVISACDGPLHWIAQQVRQAIDGV